MVIVITGGVMQFMKISKEQEGTGGLLRKMFTPTSKWGPSTNGRQNNDAVIMHDKKEGMTGVVNDAFRDENDA